MATTGVEFDIDLVVYLGVLCDDHDAFSTELNRPDKELVRRLGISMCNPPM